MQTTVTVTELKAPETAETGKPKTWLFVKSATVRNGGRKISNKILSGGQIFG